MASLDVKYKLSNTGVYALSSINMSIILSLETGSTLNADRINWS
jgi:hypothetical protein